MTDREKVIKGLECCELIHRGALLADSCNLCPYQEDKNSTCETGVCELLFEARRLLKDQEPKEWIYCEDDQGQDGYQCSGCGFFEPWYYDYASIDFIRKYQFCPSCGAIMNAKGE